MKGQVEKLGRKIGVKGCGEGMRLKDGMKGWDKDWDKVWDQYLGLIEKVVQWYAIISIQGR